MASVFTAEMVREREGPSQRAKEIGLAHHIRSPMREGRSRQEPREAGQRMYSVRSVLWYFVVHVEPLGSTWRYLALSEKG